VGFLSVFVNPWWTSAGSKRIDSCVAAARGQSEMVLSDPMLQLGTTNRLRLDVTDCGPLRNAAVLHMGFFWGGSMLHGHFRQTTMALPTRVEPGEPHKS
jgi:hypothetical protein